MFACEFFGYLIPLLDHNESQNRASRVCIITGNSCEFVLTVPLRLDRFLEQGVSLRLIALNSHFMNISWSFVLRLLCLLYPLTRFARYTRTVPRFWLELLLRCLWSFLLAGTAVVSEVSGQWNDFAVWAVEQIGLQNFLYQQYAACWVPAFSNTTRVQRLRWREQCNCVYST